MKVSNRRFEREASRSAFSRRPIALREFSPTATMMPEKMTKLIMPTTPVWETLVLGRKGN